jgi:hypothetical protein
LRGIDGISQGLAASGGLQTDIRYDELRLRIYHGAGGYCVRAEGPTGSADGSFVPLPDLEIENFKLKLHRPRSVRRVRSPFQTEELNTAHEFGMKLFKALLSDANVLGVYRDARARTLHDLHEERGLRVTLSLGGAPELMRVPWEFMCDERTFLSQSIYTPVVRSLDLPAARPPRKITLPLRILGIASSPEGYEELDISGEQEKLYEALRPLIEREIVDVHWLEHPTLAELVNEVIANRKIHILHYVGHGDYDERTQSGVIVLEDDRGQAHPVTGEMLGSILYDARSLRLVVLNSCRGAESGPEDPFSGVAEGLVHKEIPAVIGMQFEISDEAAIAFAKALYTSLAAFQPIDAALAQARTTIFALPGLGAPIEFGTPVLFLRGTDARLFHRAFKTTSSDPGSTKRKRKLSTEPPEGSLRAQVLALSEDALRVATGDSSRAALEQVIDRLRRPTTQRPALCTDAVDADNALLALTSLSFRYRELAFLRDNVETLRLGGPGFEVIPAAKWFLRSHSEDIGVPGLKLRELERLLTARSGAGRLGLGADAGGRDVSAAALSRAIAWKQFENDASTTLLGRRVASDVVRLYERMSETTQLAERR